LEGDIYIGKDHKEAIVTINEKSIRMLKMKKINTRDVEELEQAIIEQLKDLNPFIRRQ